MTEKKPADGQRTIFICQGTGCVSGKSIEITEALKKTIAELGLQKVNVDFTGCHGVCEQGPIAIVEPDGVFYTHVTLNDVPEIVSSHLKDGQPVERLFYKDPVTGQAVRYHNDIKFYNMQSGKAHLLQPAFQIAFNVVGFIPLLFKKFFKILKRYPMKDQFLLMKPEFREKTRIFDEKDITPLLKSRVVLKKLMRKDQNGFHPPV